jgi:hypothetical protein
MQDGLEQEPHVAVVVHDHDVQALQIIRFHTAAPRVQVCLRRYSRTDYCVLIPGSETMYSVKMARAAAGA